MSKVRYMLRVVNYLYGLFGFGVMCLLLAPLALPMALCPPRWRARLTPYFRYISYGGFVFVRWHCRMSGFATMRLVDHRGGGGAGRHSPLLIANHLAMFDIVLLFSFFAQIQTLVNAKFLANPLLWPIIRSCGYIPLRVGDAASGLKAFNELGETLARGDQVVLFPEGTRSQDGKLGPMTMGPFRLAHSAQVAPSFLFFTCNQPFLNRAAFFPKRAGGVLLEAHIMPPVALTPAGEVPAAAELAELFRSEYAAFTKSKLCLEWNHT